MMVKLQVVHLTLQLGQLVCLAELLPSAQPHKQRGSCRAFGAQLAAAAACAVAHLRASQHMHAV
jgi:hypothetical protein